MVRTFLSLLPSFCSGAQPLRPSFSTSLPDLVLLICPVRVPSLTSQLLSLSAVCCFPKPATEDLCFQKRQNLLPYLLSCPDQSRLLQGTPRFSFFGKILWFFSPSRAWQGYLLFSHLPFLCGARSVPTSRAVSLGTSHDCPHWKNLTMPNPNSLL